jgi:dTDP-4-amino-4,6-dideoxygalactose transaminase
VIPPQCLHNAHMYYLLLPDLAKRTAFIAELTGQRIQAVFHYVPLHAAPMGKKVGRIAGDLRHTVELSDRVVRLPFWLGLEEHQAAVIGRIVDAVKRRP